MKYKIEIWKYGIFDCDEAAKHLNEMARKGYFLKKMDNSPISLACYEKSNIGRNLKYVIDNYMETDKEKNQDYDKMYEDMGWKKVCENTNTNQSILLANNSNTVKPFYKDPHSKLCRLQENINENIYIALKMFGTCFSILLSIILINIIAKNSNVTVMLLPIAIIIGVCATLKALIFIVNIIILKINLKNLKMQKQEKKIKLVTQIGKISKECNIFGRIFVGFYLTGYFVYVYYSLNLISSTYSDAFLGICIAAALLSMPLIIVGVVLKLIRDGKNWGIILFQLGSIFLLGSWTALIPTILEMLGFLSTLQVFIPIILVLYYSMGCNVHYNGKRYKPKS